MFSGRKVPWNFRRGSVRTDNTNIRHDCQLIPHFANVSADKFELASAPSCGMPIGSRSLCCMLPHERVTIYAIQAFTSGFTLVTPKRQNRQEQETSSPSYELSRSREVQIAREMMESHKNIRRILQLENNLIATISDFIFKIINIITYEILYNTRTSILRESFSYTEISLYE